MNGSTLNTNTLKISGGGSQVAGVVTTSGATARFTPSSNLAYNATYTATITTGAQAANAAERSLSSDHSWSFYDSFRRCCYYANTSNQTNTYRYNFTDNCTNAYSITYTGTHTNTN